MDPQTALYGPDADEMIRRINWITARSKASTSSKKLSATILDVSHLQVHTLPHIPPFVKYLYCNGTQIRSLPPLPEGCLGLNCSDTPLESLPPLPRSLEILTCSNTLVAALPELPAALYALHCANTRLTALPELPADLNVLTTDGSPAHVKRYADERIQDYILRLRSRARARRLHEGLVAEVMHPRRVERLLELQGWEGVDAIF
jgi:hypothetical protein